MSNLYIGPSIDASYQVSYHLDERFQRKSCFRNRPIRNKNFLWWPCLLTDQNGMNNSQRTFVQVVSEERIFRNRPIRNKNCLWRPYLLMDWNEMSNLYRGPPIDAFYQVSVHLAKRFQRRRYFRNQPIRNKNCLWWPCLLTDREKISNVYRGPSMDASNQVSVHLAKRFQRRFFRNQPIRNKNCLWWPCLLTDWDEMSNLNREPSIDASYQVSVHLAKRFQRRRI
jgi:hypothetical protein